MSWSAHQYQFNAFFEADGTVRQLDINQHKLSDAEKAALKERVKQLVDTVNALGEIKAGTSIVFDWIPEKGTVLTIGSQQKGKDIPGEDFYIGLLKVWLGEDPAQNDLKGALLGKPQ